MKNDDNKCSGNNASSTLREENVSSSPPKDPLQTEQTQNIPSPVQEDIGESAKENNSATTREHTRSKMALVFVLGFFSIIYLCFLYAIITRSTLNELKEILVAIIGALSSTLGFIIGYYYKSTHE